MIGLFLSVGFKGSYDITNLVMPMFVDEYVTVVMFEPPDPDGVSTGPRLYVTYVFSFDELDAYVMFLFPFNDVAPCTSTFEGDSDMQALPSSEHEPFCEPGEGT